MARSRNGGLQPCGPHFITHTVSQIQNQDLSASITHVQGPRGYSTMVNLFRGTGYWAPRKAMPFFRSDHAVVTWNDTAYLVGGQTVDAANTTQKIVLNKLVAYDAVYSEYRNLTDMPEPR